MKTSFKNQLATTLFTTAFATVVTANLAMADTLTLEVSTTTNEGAVMAALFDGQAGFAAYQPIAVAKSTATQGTTQVTFDKLLDGTTDLKTGTYGIALFHDVNDNKTLDLGDYGIPTEPTGFSTNPGNLHRAPVFDDFKFDFSDEAQTVKITLQTY